MRARIWTACVAAVLAAGLVACGDKDTGDEGAGDTPTPETVALEIEGSAWLGDEPDLSQGTYAIAFFKPT